VLASSAIELGAGDLAGRLAEAAALGAVIGFERETAARGAGARTHALVALGSAVFTIAGAYGFADVFGGGEPGSTRVAAQVATGVGFIGAGAIVRSGLTVQGITTAATVWLAAAIGVAVGAGGGLLAALAVGMALLVLLGLHAAAPLLQRITRQRVVIDVSYERGFGTLGPLLQRLDEVSGRLEQLRIDDADSGDLRRVRLFATVPHGVDTSDLLGDVPGLPEVHSIRVMPTET
jgi:putative Mg2+ transporter-C (MgtC) family protein